MSNPGTPNGVKRLMQSPGTMKRTVSSITPRLGKRKFIPEMKKSASDASFSDVYDSDDDLHHPRTAKSEQLEAVARALAEEITTSDQASVGRSLVSKLTACTTSLQSAYAELSEAYRGSQAMTPATEWFIDNFFIVEEQLRDIQRDLPPNYYYELPKIINDGDLSGYPRVYAIASSIVSHTNSRLSADNIKRFIDSFQIVTALTIGELWAVSITLRIVLVEHLTVLANRIVRGRAQRARADYIADRLLAIAKKTNGDADSLKSFLVSEFSDPSKFEISCVVQVVQRLRDQDPDVQPAFNWITQQLSLHFNKDIKSVTQYDQHRQVVTQLTVGNIISSMRLLSALDWTEFFESVSIVDMILGRDPSETYDHMDFTTRNNYRNAIQRLARGSRLSELDVAEKAVEAADHGLKQDPNDIKKSHIGYYLVDDGCSQFEYSIQYRSKLSESIFAFILENATAVFYLLLILAEVITIAPVLIYAFLVGGWTSVIYIGLLAIIPTSQLALSALNFVITLFVKPNTLPRINTEAGIPEDAKTIVVIPCLLTSAKTAQYLINRLEVHFLANKDPNIYFALLSDYADADTQILSTDINLFKILQNGIISLNTQHCSTDEPHFFLFHRKRLYNTSVRRWIGWERKRGKIEEFNRLLGGATDTSYETATADPALLKEIKYVITLDADTQLPRTAGHKLIGTIIHPLNQPHFDPLKKRVTYGYGVLQPRVSVDLMSSKQSRFAKLFSGNTGLDTYTSCISDVYQDLFLEGSFTGKGLYVVSTFQQALHDRVPENTILSHDLFEGCLARSGFVSDIEVFDDYPSDYETFSKRQHRWTRGDWQLLLWLLPFVPTASKKWVRNPLSLISVWKLFDNLRRSLIAPLLYLWLIVSWVAVPGSPLIWTALAVNTLMFPYYSLIVNVFITKAQNVSLRSHLYRCWQELQLTLAHILLSITFLSDSAYNQVDAIIRTLYRMFISGLNLLQWVSFSEAQSTNKDSLTEIRLAEYIAVLLTAVVLSSLNFETILAAIPICATWLVAPLLKSWLREGLSQTPALSEADSQTFRFFARRTWHFFETFVTAEDNYLAPDNFQADPKAVVAHRTSPTNIGLHFLSVVSAYDMGFVGFLEMIDLIEKTMTTIGKLDRIRGHFFNWYDTKTLKHLEPRYISTVDSGNLAGYLLTLKQSCHELIQRYMLTDQWPAGILATLQHCKQQVDYLRNDVHSADGVVLHLHTAIETMITQAKGCQALSLADWDNFLTTILSKAIEAADVLEALKVQNSKLNYSDCQEWISALLNQLRQFQRDLKWCAPSPTYAFDENTRLRTRGRLEVIINKCSILIDEMNFSFLLDPKRQLFHIGCDVNNNYKLDASFYDFLASESRLASFIAIAKGDVSQTHWFRLGRQLTEVHGGRALISWTASMFEYLMPALVMQSYPDTLLDQTIHAVVQRQIEYGQERRVPWGISEAGFNARDLNLNYQYGPFGIPGLGLKRGLSYDLVISPYSTMLAAMIDPTAALENLHQLIAVGALKRYGFCESLDYTPSRLPENWKCAIVHSFMAHHQGMSIVALNNLLNGNIMQQRFHSSPLIQATQLLLQENIPRDTILAKPRSDEVPLSSAALRLSAKANPRVYLDVSLPTPRTQLLSNGTYSLMLSSAGSGYSRCGPLAVSRWIEDATRDASGAYFYIRNRTANAVWSATYQPMCVMPNDYEVTFAEDKVTFSRKDNQLVTSTEVIVSFENNVELRRITLTNSGDMCEVDVTSYMEVVIAPPADDSAHPAFGNLFVQTEFIADRCALLATRRRRSLKDAEIWGFHVVVADEVVRGSLQYETDRARFIGRGMTTASPRVIQHDIPLSNTVGSVLDPIFSLRQRLRIGAGARVRIIYVTGMADNRDEALRLIDKYQDIHAFRPEADMAWTQSQVQLRHLNLSSDASHSFQRLAGRVLFSDPSLRPRSAQLKENTRAQTNLWAYGISGDLPIILTRISDEKDMNMVKEVLHAHEYLRLKGLIIDLVILNEHPPSYNQNVEEEFKRQVRMTGSQVLLDKPGGVFFRRVDLIPKQDIILLCTVARVIFIANSGTLDEQLKRRPTETDQPAKLMTTSSPYPYTSPALVRPQLSHFNGLGGFWQNGQEYVIILENTQWTPAPWINVIANKHDFGCTISESGSGYTFSVNSRENRLTPWSNDPVCDPVGEAIYIRDEDSGEFWSPTPLPIREKETYVVRHGQGYSQFEHNSHGIAQILQVFVSMDDPVKYYRLKLTNQSDRTRHLSVTGYIEWVLGVLRCNSVPTVYTQVDPTTGAILAQNVYSHDFGERVAFMDINDKSRTFTCDRKEFIGRHGSAANPLAMSRQKLSGTSGGGLDQCAAVQTVFKLAVNETREVIIIIGQGENQQAAVNLVKEYQSLSKAESCLKASNTYWEQTLGTIEIKTPDAAMNLLVNRWLLYQTISCRIWARTAFYQSGGAFGFRDQLQDMMALVYTHPELVRAHLVLCSSRQFKEGDVQHWWHPPKGQGVRTHISDDLIWLPFVTAFYIKRTGDDSILKEVTPFLEAPPLKPHEESSYTSPKVSEETANILEHCMRTLDRSLITGAHGLPLMGSGDWNDGMNRVGGEGRGESVWLAWFLVFALKEFKVHCRGDEHATRLQSYEKAIINICKAIESEAWDGHWYRRAYFDDGTVLGSSTNDECRIDSIAQSWSVISGAGETEHAKMAMASVDELLVQRSDGLIKLFSPPFDKGTVDPGYIRGYVPGVRENGGQYTHAALWTVMAFAELGDGDRAAELFALLNPIHHASTRAGVEKYKTEPYVIAADVYGMQPHTGRGGWSWYTGSSGWMYRTALEAICGFDLRGDRLIVKPSIPKDWRQIEITYKRGKATYHIVVDNQNSSADNKSKCTMDGTDVPNGEINVQDDGKTHQVRIQL